MNLKRDMILDLEFVEDLAMDMQTVLQNDVLSEDSLLELSTSIDILYGVARDTFQMFNAVMSEYDIEDGGSEDEQVH